MNAQLLGNVSHALACWRTHPPSHISLARLVVVLGRAGEVSSFLADGQLVDHAIAAWLDQ